MQNCVAAKLGQKVALNLLALLLGFFMTKFQFQNAQSERERERKRTTRETNNIMKPI